MKRLIPAGLAKARQLQPALTKIAEKGFVHIGDCIVFSGERDNRNEFPDSIGYECCANHIHLDDFLSDPNPQEIAEQAIALAAILNQQLRVMAPNVAFRYIISVDDDGGGTFRFHIVRAGEESMADDLEGFKEEAIAVIDSVDFQSNASVVGGNGLS